MDPSITGSRLATYTTFRSSNVELYCPTMLPRLTGALYRRRSAIPSNGLFYHLEQNISKRTLMPPQQRLLRKSTGLVTFITAGKRSRNSSSWGTISFFISRICGKMMINEKKLFIITFTANANSRKNT